MKNMRILFILQKSVSDDEEAERIITMVAKLILGGIRTATYNCDSYPCDAAIKSTGQGLEWLPHSLS